VLQKSRPSTGKIIGGLGGENKAKEPLTSAEDGDRASVAVTFTAGAGGGTPLGGSAPSHRKGQVLLQRGKKSEGRGLSDAVDGKRPLSGKMGVLET